MPAFYFEGTHVSNFAVFFPFRQENQQTRRGDMMRIAKPTISKNHPPHHIAQITETIQKIKRRWRLEWFLLPKQGDRRVA
jgi:hypothetical protein